MRPYACVYVACGETVPANTKHGPCVETWTHPSFGLEFAAFFHWAATGKLDGVSQNVDKV